MIFWAWLFLWTILIAFFGCVRQGEFAAEEELEEEIVEIEEQEVTSAPPAPKMTEELYIDLTARAALIWDKYKEEAEKAQREVDELYLKAGVTWKEVQEFEAKLTLQERDQLQKKIMEYMQKIIHEYK